MSVTTYTNIVSGTEIGPNGALDRHMGNALYGQPKLLPGTWRDEGPALEKALGRIEAALQARDPRIELSEVVYPSDLLRALLFGAEAEIYFYAITSGSDAEVWHAKWKATDQRFANILKGLRPRISTASGERSAAQNWLVERA